MQSKKIKRLQEIKKQAPDNVKKAIEEKLRHIEKPIYKNEKDILQGTK